ncbi:hypothetical protein [Desulfobacter postgatei]|jgi:tetratricopeptide (TPR) repeat protein|uniref:hypothetical protein n=1 Tax=Desulfobacter postgatei TaxID=2293 RepID=UPI002A35D52D|nr:hypothetical protein [Desulfobacter postgatei]MDX9964213.1 hypothetical protein [Desulfobacter postgatei]
MRISSSIKKDAEMKFIFSMILGILVFFYSFTAYAGIEELEKNLAGTNKAKAHELQYLPSYCKCKSAENITPEYRKKCGAHWGKVFSKYPHGKDAMHLHHYCYALTYLHRYRMGLGDPSSLFKAAEANLNYVITRSHPKFILMPEFLYKMGTTQQLMGKNDKALQYFYKSIKVSTKYVPAYIEIIKYYQSISDVGNAIKVTRKGLEYSPNSVPLKKKLAELQSLKK